MATTVGEAVIKLSFDGKDLKTQLVNVSSEMEKNGTTSGTKWGTAWSVAIGSLMSKGVSKALSMVTSNIESAVKRVDVLNNFPKVMSNLGISSEEASESIQLMSEKLQGLPTTLDQGASAVQRFTSKNGDVAKSTDIFLALNNAILAGGQSTDIQATALEQLSQAYAKGKPDMMEWRSVMQAMPAQLKQIATAMGYGENGIEELGEALRNGEVSMDDFMNTISTLNTDGVDGFKNFEEQARNSTGGIQTAIKVMNSRISQGIAEVINAIGAERIDELAIGIGNAVKEVGKVVANVVNFVIDHWNVIGPILGTVAAFFAAGAVVSGVTKLASAIGGLKNSFLGLFSKGALGGFGDKMKGVATSIADTVKRAGEAVAGFIKAFASPDVLLGAAGFAAAAGSIALAILMIGSAVGAVMPALEGLMNNIIIPIATFIANTVLGLIDTLTKAIVTITQQAFIPLGEFLANTFIAIINTLTDVVVRLTNSALVPLINAISGAFIGVLRAVSDILTNVVKVALEGVAEIVKATGVAFEGMGHGIEMALNGVNAILSTFADLIKSIADAVVAVVALVQGRSINYGRGYAHLFAEGGKVEGPGTSTSDSIPARLSNGEFVIKASSAKLIGYDVLDDMNDSGKLPASGIVYNWAGVLANTIGGTMESKTGGEINVYMTNQINNRLDAQDIGRTMIKSIREAA